MDSSELIRNVKSGVLQIQLEVNHEKIGNGTALLYGEGIITNSHVIRRYKHDAIVLRFFDSSPKQEIRFIPDTINENIIWESTENEFDLIYMRVHEPEFESRHIFEVENSDNIREGEKMLFIGYPFGMPNITSHIGFVSSIHTKKNIKIIQIDGSVNGGNSGGPLISLNTGKVIGVITKAVTGIIENQFNELIKVLKQNQNALKVSINSGISTSIAGVNPIQALNSSMVIMEYIAKDLHRSANVGIGYAYSINNVIGHLIKSQKK